VKRGVIHSLITQAKVICQDQKDFSNEIRNIRHDLMFSEYPQECVDFLMKPSRSSLLDAIWQDTVIIPYIKDISKKFRHIANSFNVRTIFETKCTHFGTLTKTGPVRGAQQTNQVSEADVTLAKQANL
jgi:hypothetical protein